MTPSQQVEVKLVGSSFAEVLFQAKKFLADYEKVAGSKAVDTTEPLTGTGPSTKKTKKAAPVVEEVVAEDEDLLADGPANAPSDSEDDSLSFDDTEEEEAPKKTKKQKALKVEDVNAAAIAYAKVHGRPAALKILKTKFKTESVKEIPEAKYADVIKAFEV